MDTFTKEQRSECMSKIRAKNTKPEIIVRSLLHKMGYRFRLHKKDLAGKPDIVLKKYKTVIFCHGCFWHQHERCKRANIPKSNEDYWISKLQRNIERFEIVRNQLEKNGWNVKVIWECETKRNDELRNKIISFLKVSLHGK